MVSNNLYLLYTTVANVSCGGDQYNHTINTLKYADRAKEIKTHVVGWWWLRVEMRSTHGLK